MDYEAGRELDALVGEKVMDWYVDRTPADIPKGWQLADGQKFPSYRDGTFNFTVPHFSTDIADAWLIVERMAKVHARLLRLHDNRSFPASLEYWQAKFHEPGAEFDGYVSASSAPLAICLAALKAVG